MLLEILIAVGVGYLVWRIETMSEALKTATDALIAETADTQGKLASIKTYLEGLPDVVAAAVSDALTAAHVADDEAAAQIDAARAAISDSVDDTLAAISENPAPEDAPVEPPVEPDEPTG